MDLNDVKQLRRLERYMREEGFPQTAKVAKERLETLGETVDDSDETHKLNAQEIEGILDDLKSWEVVMKSSSRKASDPNAQQSSAPVRKIHKGTQDKSHSPDKNTAKEAYYEKWDKLAREIEEVVITGCVHFEIRVLLTFARVRTKLCLLLLENSGR